MRKTAMSSIIYEVLDMGTGIIDAKGELASLRRRHPGLRRRARQGGEGASLAKFDKPGDIEPGDVFATNDPYYGGVTHLNDIVVAMPVFADGQLIAWTANIAHNSDVGGMAPGSLTGEATEIFQEGLRLPAIKIISEGQADRTRSSTSSRSIRRMPDVLRGDVWAAIASVRIGERAAERACAQIWRGDLQTRDEAVHGLRRAGVARRADGPAQGHVHLSEEQDDGTHLQRQDHHHRRRASSSICATTPTSRPGPVNT